MLTGLIAIGAVIALGLAGCPTDADDGGGNSLTIKVKNTKSSSVTISQLNISDYRSGGNSKTVNFDPALTLAVGETSSQSWELTGLYSPDGKVQCGVMVFDASGNYLGSGNTGLVDPGSTCTVDLN